MPGTVVASSGDPFYDFAANGTAAAANLQTAMLSDGDIVVT